MRIRAGRSMQSGEPSAKAGTRQSSGRSAAVTACQVGRGQQEAPVGDVRRRQCRAAEGNRDVARPRHQDGAGASADAGAALSVDLTGDDWRDEVGSKERTLPNGKSAAGKASRKKPAVVELSSDDEVSPYCKYSYTF